MTDKLVLHIPNPLEEQDNLDEFMGTQISVNLSNSSPTSTSYILPMSSEEVTSTDQNAESMKDNKLHSPTSSTSGDPLHSEIVLTSSSSVTIDDENSIPLLNLLELVESTQYDDQPNSSRNDRTAEDIEGYSPLNCSLTPDIFVECNEDCINEKEKAGVLSIEHIHTLKRGNSGNLDLSNEISDLEEPILNKSRPIENESILLEEDFELTHVSSVRSLDLQYSELSPIVSPTLSQDGSRRHYNGIDFESLNAEINDINRFIDKIGVTMRDNILQNSLLSNTRNKYDSKETRSRYTDLKNPNSFDSSFSHRGRTASGDSEQICNETHGFCCKNYPPSTSTLLNRNLNSSFTTEMGDMFDKVLTRPFSPNFAHTLNEINELNNSISIISLDIQNAMQEGPFGTASFQRDIGLSDLNQNQFKKSCIACGCCCKSKISNTSLQLPQFLNHQMHSSFMLDGLDLNSKCDGNPSTATNFVHSLLLEEQHPSLKEDTVPSRNNDISNNNVKTTVASALTSDSIEATTSKGIRDSENTYQGIPDELLCYKSNLGTYELSDIICNDDKKMIANLEENTVLANGEVYILNDQSKHPWDEEPDTYLNHLTPDLHPTPVESLQVVFDRHSDLLDELQPDELHDLYTSHFENEGQNNPYYDTTTEKTSASNLSDHESEIKQNTSMNKHSKKHIKTSKDNSNPIKSSRRPLSSKEFAGLAKAHKTGHWQIKDKATSEKLEYIRYRISCQMDDIAQQLKYRIVEPDGMNERIKRQKRDIEFSSLFARNYLYQLARMLPLLIKSVKGMNKNQTNYHATCSIVLTYHKTIYHGLQAFLRHMPTTLIGGLTNRVKVLLEYYVELNNIGEDCSLFYVDTLVYNKIKRLMQCARYSYEDRRTIRTSQASPVTRYTFSPSALTMSAKAGLKAKQSNKSKNLSVIPEDLKMYASQIGTESPLRPKTAIPRKMLSPRPLPKKTQSKKVGGTESIHMYTKKDDSPKQTENKTDSGKKRKSSAKKFHSCRTHRIETEHITTKFNDIHVTKEDSHIVDKSGKTIKQYRAKTATAVVREVRPDREQDTSNPGKSTPGFVYDDPDIVTLLQRAEQSVMNIKASHKKAITKFSELYRYNPKKAFEIKRKDWSREYTISRNDDDTLIDLIDGTYEIRNEIRTYVWDSCSSENTSNLKKKASNANESKKTFQKTPSDIFTRLYENKTKWESKAPPTAPVTKKRESRIPSAAKTSETKKRPQDSKAPIVVETARDAREAKGAIPRSRKPLNTSSKVNTKSTKTRNAVKSQKDSKPIQRGSKKSWEAKHQPSDTMTDISSLNNAEVR